jgi:hypothetical protein
MKVWGLRKGLGSVPPAEPPTQTTGKSFAALLAFIDIHPFKCSIQYAVFTMLRAVPGELVLLREVLTKQKKALIRLGMIEPQQAYCRKGLDSAVVSTDHRQQGFQVSWVGLSTHFGRADHCSKASAC